KQHNTVLASIGYRIPHHSGVARGTAAQVDYVGAMIGGVLDASSDAENVGHAEGRKHLYWHNAAIRRHQRDQAGDKGPMAGNSRCRVSGNLGRVIVIAVEVPPIRVVDQPVIVVVYTVTRDIAVHSVVHPEVRSQRGMSAVNARINHCDNLAGASGPELGVVES